MAEMTVGEKKVNTDDLSEKQLQILNQLKDLDQKLERARFNLTQMEGGRKFFYDELEKTLP